MECYGCVMAMLEEMEQGGAEIKRKREAAVSQALQSRDPLFHACLYNFFLEKGRADELIQVRFLFHSFFFSFFSFFPLFLFISDKFLN
jgi:hypothetical protein